MALPDPIADVSAFRQFAERHHPQVGHHALKLTCDLADVSAAGLVIIFEHGDALLAGEPAAEFGPPLAGAAGVGRGDQAERGDRIGIFFTFANKNPIVGRRRDQLGQAIGKFDSRRAELPARIRPRPLRKLFRRRARDLLMICPGRVAVDVFREESTA